MTEVRKSVGYQQQPNGKIVDVVGVWSQDGKFLRWEEVDVQLELPEQEFKLNIESSAARCYRITVTQGLMEVFHKNWNMELRQYGDWSLQSSQNLTAGFNF